MELPWKAADKLRSWVQINPPGPFIPVVQLQHSLSSFSVIVGQIQMHYVVATFEQILIL
jgi:hypothetical protein